MEVSDKNSNAGQFMGIQGKEHRAPFFQDRWMRLGKERKRQSLAGEFAPTAKDDHVVLG